MRCLVAIFTLVLLSVEARADEPDADVRSVIDRGLTFLAKDNLAWKESKKCYECHHARLLELNSAFDAQLPQLNQLTLHHCTCNDRHGRQMRVMAVGLI